MTLLLPLILITSSAVLLVGGITGTMVVISAGLSDEERP